MSDLNPLILKACEAVGCQARLAERLGMKKQFLSQLARGKRPIPPRWCIPIEEATAGAVTRYDLRPDIFGEPSQAD